MKKFIYSALLFSLLLLIYLLHADLNSKKPASINIKESNIKRQVELTGWFSYFDEDKSAISLHYVFPYLKIFSPALYEVSSDGGLKKITVKNRQDVLFEAGYYNLPVYPVINDGGKRENLKFLLDDEETRKDFTDDLISEAVKNGFKGYSLDFESFKSEDKDDFVTLSKYIYEKLHQNNLELHNILFGREENETYDAALAHPYKELAQYADRIYLMVYNFNNQHTSPGGQTPIDWYRKVLDYAVKTVPREKLVIGLSGHGYQWTGTKIKGLSYWDVMDLISSNQPKINFNSSQSAEYFSYQNEDDEESIVYYDDSKAIVDKVKIARNDFGVDKFAIWRIGAEDPKIWPSLVSLE